MPEIQLYSRAQKPVERYLVDGLCPSPVCHRRCVMPRGINMGSVVRGKPDLLECERLPIDQIFGLEVIVSVVKDREGVLMVQVIDLKLITRWVGGHIVFDRHGQIDDTA